MPVDWHICELRLILKEFASLWTPEFQTASVLYRNSRRFFKPRMPDAWQTYTSYVCVRCWEVCSALFGRRNREQEGARVVPEVEFTGPTEGVEMGVGACGGGATSPGSSREAWVGDEGNAETGLCMQSSSEVAFGVPGEETNAGEGVAADGPVIAMGDECDHQNPVRLDRAAAPDRAEARKRWKGNQPRGRSIERMKEVGDLVWMTTWGVKLGRLDIGRLERICRLCVLGLPTTLDNALSRRIPSVGQGNAWTTSMLFTESPTAIAKLRRVQAASMLIAILLIWSGWPSPYTTMDLPASYAHYRYTSFASRNGSKATEPGVSEFEIVHVGEGNCMVHLAAKNLRGDDRGKTFYSHTASAKGSSIYLSFCEPAPFSGWALHYPEGGADKSNFAVYASNYPGARGDASMSMAEVPEDSWELIGTPQWYVNTSTDHPTPLQALVVGRIDLKSVDMPAEEGWTQFEPMIYTYALMPGIELDANTPRKKRVFHSDIPSNIFAYGVGLFLFSLSGILGRVSFARSGIIVGLVLACALSFAYALSFFHRSDNSPARRAICSTFSRAPSCLPHSSGVATRGYSSSSALPSLSSSGRSGARRYTTASGRESSTSSLGRGTSSSSPRCMPSATLADTSRSSTQRSSCTRTRRCTMSCGHARWRRTVTMTTAA